MAISIEAFAVLTQQLLALFFLLAAIGKLLNRSAAITSIEAYRLVPKAIARLSGISLPWVELAIATFLFAGFMPHMAAALALVLLLAFSIAQAIILLRGDEVPCGCFGSLSTQPVRWPNLLINFTLIGACLVVMTPFPAATEGRLFWSALGLGNPTPLSLSDAVALRATTTVFFLQCIACKQYLVNRRLYQDQLEYDRSFAQALAIQRIAPNTLIIQEGQPVL